MGGAVQFFWFNLIMESHETRRFYMKHQSNLYPRYIREKDLLKILPISKSTLWRKVAAEEFPKPIKLSQKITAWKTSDVDDWFAEQDLGG